MTSNQKGKSNLEQEPLLTKTNSIQDPLKVREQE